MSLYSMLFGTHGYPPEVMGAFGLTQEMVGRYRDHWFEQDHEHEGERITLALYTRMGGGNREEYAENLDQMHTLPTFISDEDDTFDSTYCTLRFSIDKASMMEWLGRCTEVPGEDVVQQEWFWRDMIRQALPERLDMAPVWEAMLSSMAGHVDDGE